MKIYIGADHAGFELKEVLVPALNELGHTVEDMGATTLNPEDDFNDFIVPVAQAVAKDPDTVRGIILGGSGQGEAIAANRFRGVRACVYYGGSEQIIRWSREHNNSNILSLGARLLTYTEAKLAVELWLSTDFSIEGKYARRNRKIEEMS